MSGCRCEPHASGSNRCDFCRYESAADDKLHSAVSLIDAITKNLKADPSAACDTWLENNGFDCESKRKERKAARARALDAEIERLRTERARL